MPDRTPPRHDCPNCGPGGPGPSTTETVRGGRRLRTPGRTKTGPTIASEQISVAATTDTTRDNNPACDVLRMRLTRVLDECRSTYIPGDQAALVLAELAPELDELADYRNRITWETNCGEHARLLDSSYAETVRAETAEAEVKRLTEELAGAWATLDHMTKAMSWISGHDRQGLDHLEEAQYEGRSRFAAVKQAQQWAGRAKAAQAALAEERERQDRYEEAIVGRFNQQAINLSRRAEQAEAAIARVEAELDRTDQMLGTDGETFATAAGARIHAQRIRAALNPPTDPGAAPAVEQQPLDRPGDDPTPDPDTGRPVAPAVAPTAAIPYVAGQTVVPRPLTDEELLPWLVVEEHRMRSAGNGGEADLRPFPPCPGCGAEVGTATVMDGLTLGGNVHLMLDPCRHGFWFSPEAVGRLRDAVRAVVDREGRVAR